MRVIAGFYRSRKIERPKSFKVRPTLDRVKESLFSILEPKLPDSKIVDFFSGSGSLGIEAISRGAEHVTFIDNDKDSIEVIKKNLVSLGVPAEKSLVIHSSAVPAADKLKREKKKFDIIFLDPPYGKTLIPEVMGSLSEGSLVNPLCWLVAEHHKKETLPEVIHSFSCFRRKNYGDVAISFYKLVSASTNTADEEVPGLSED